MRSKPLAIALSAAVSLGGCNQAGPQGSLAEVQDPLGELQSEIRSLKSEINDLRLAGSNESARRGEPLLLDPTGGQGFSVHMSQYGTLTYRVTGVSSVGDGSRVAVEVGNLTSASFNGGNMKATYGVRGPTFARGDDLPTAEDVFEYLDWLESLSEADVSFTTTLSPGRWNTISITLPGIVPDRLGYLKLEEIEFPRISLMR